MEKQQGLSRTNNFGKKGWLLLILCLLGFFTSTSASGSINVGAAHFIEIMGVTQTQLMWAPTIGQLVGAVIGIFCTNFFIKRSPRRTIMVCAVIYAVAFFLNGMSQRYWQYMLTFIIFMAAVYVWTFMCSTALVANWFPRKRGAAMGVITIGMPLGSGIAATIMSAIQLRTGFYISYIPYALLGLVVAILVLVCLRDFPSECGCYPDNDRNFDMEKLKEEEAKMKQLQDSSPWTPKRVLGTWQFWFIMFATAFMMFASGFMAQVVPTLMTYGISAAAAPRFMLLICGVACVGSYFMGLLDMKIGSKRSIIVVLCGMIAMGLIAQIPFLVTKIVAFMVMALVMGAGSNFILSIVMKYWGQRSTMKVYRFLQPFNTVISAFSTTIIAAIAAAAGGNYNISFLVCAGLCVVGLIFMGLIKDGFVEKKEEKFAEQDKAKQAS